MNERSQERKIRAFLKGNNKRDIDTFCLYQWLERCHFHGWWNLGLTLGSQIPCGTLNKEYQKRLEFLLAECRRNYEDKKDFSSKPRTKSKESYTYKTKLVVSGKAALDLLKRIRHSKFNRVLEGSWQVDAEGNIKAQSVLWLFCWAKTGNGSLSTANEVISVFDMIIPIRFEVLDKKMDHSWAQIMRYSKDNIEEDFASILN